MYTWTNMVASRWPWIGGLSNVHKPNPFPKLKRRSHHPVPTCTCMFFLYMYLLWFSAHESTVFFPKHRYQELENDIKWNPQHPVRVYLTFIDVLCYWLGTVSNDLIFSLNDVTILLALLDYISIAHEIAICRSSVVRPSVSQLSLNLMHGFLSNCGCCFLWAIRSDVLWI